MKTVILRPDTLPYVLDALKEAGVEYVLETPEQARIRELEDQNVALRKMSDDMRDRIMLMGTQNRELREENAVLRAANNGQSERLGRAEASAQTWKFKAEEWESKSNYWMGRLEDLLKEKAPRF